MSATLPALLVASGGVGLAHSVLPDHWLPLAVAARARRDPLARVARMSLLAGAAHVLVSMALGAVVIAVGLSLRSVIASRTGVIVGALLVATGVGFLVADRTGHGGHHHDHHDHDHDHHDQYEPATAGEVGRRPAPRGLSLVIPFGAAASPDLTILPVFLAAAAFGTTAAIGSLIVFAAVTITVFVALTLLAAAGAHQLTHPWIDEHANTVTALVVIVIGALVIAGVL